MNSTMTDPKVDFDLKKQSKKYHMNPVNTEGLPLNLVAFNRKGEEVLRVQNGEIQIHRDDSYSLQDVIVGLIRKYCNMNGSTAVVSPVGEDTYYHTDKIVKVNGE